MTRVRPFLSLARVTGVGVVTAGVLVIPGRALAAPPAAPADPIVAAVRAVKASSYPDANAVRVLDEQSVVYQKDGTYVQTIHTVDLALTQKGRDAIATGSLDYDTDHDHIEGVTARVIKADGTILPVPASAIKDTVHGGAVGMNIYSGNERMVEVAFPDVSIGDAVELSGKDVVTKPVRPGFVEDFHFLEGIGHDFTPAGPSFEPVAHASYEVDGPADMPPTYRVYHQERAGKIQLATSTANGRVHYHWTVEATPQMIPEALMDFETEVPSIVWSTDADWRHMSTWCSKLDEPKLGVTDAIKKKVAELTRNAKTDDEKIKALYDFVSADIRYRGGDTTMAGAEPYAADDTLKKRWGVCRDVAVLLVSMLRAAGFHAYPAITNAMDPIPPDIARTELNHEIAVIEWPDRKGADRFQFIDPTAKNSVDLLPPMEHQQQAYVCTPEGEDLTTTPPAPPASSTGHIQIATTLDGAGALDSHVTFTSSGVFDLALRSMGALVSPAQQQHYVEEILHASMPEAELVSFSLSSPLALTRPMTAQAEIKVPNAVLTTGRYRLARTLLTSGALDVVADVLPEVVGSKPTRDFTLDTRITFEFDQDETVTLPAGAEVAALPNDVTSENAVSSLTSKCTRAAGAVTCHRSFQLKSRFIDPAQYTELRSVLASTKQVAHQPIILTAAKPATVADRSK